MKNVIIIILILVAIAMPAFFLMHLHSHNIIAVAKEQKKEARLKMEQELRYDLNVRDSSQRGYILSTPSDSSLGFGYLAIIDFKGNLIFKKAMDRAVFDFRQWHIGNKIFYSYITNDSETFHYSGVCVADGHVVILDSAMNSIREVHLVPHDDVNGGHKNDIDFHDFIMLSENHFIIMLNYEKKVSNIPAGLNPARNVKVGACIIQELVDGNVVWQWDATHYPELYVNSTALNNFSTDTATQDYCQLNSMTIDPHDSNLILSFRELNQVVKINRKNGEIIWRLGGKNSDFPLTPDQVFLKQHSVTLANNNECLLMLDNGDFDTRVYSRVLEFRLDEKNKKVISCSAYNIPHMFSLVYGNVLKMGDNYLIGGGLAKYMLLVDPKNDKYLMEIRENFPSYRIYKVDSLYGLEKQSKQQ